MNDKSGHKRKILSRVLTVLFLVALLMGPGPGSIWAGGESEEPRIWFGIPALYLWVVFWYMVMAGCVVLAATILWREQD